MTSPVPGDVTSEADARLNLRQLGIGHRVARCLQVIAELGVADHLGEQPESSETLAAAVGADPPALARVLRALASHGVFEEIGAQFRHSPASRLLRSDHPQSQRSFVRLRGAPIFWGAYGQLEHSIRTGEPAATRIAPGGVFEYFATHPEEGRLFDEAMTEKSREQIASVLAAYDFSRFESIADIGGGRGHLLQAVLAANPDAKGVLFDLPEVIGPNGSLASERLTLRTGSFFTDPLPTCDGYLLMNVIHDWGDAEALAILSAVQRAAPAHARVLLLEMLMPDSPGAHPAKLLDIEMLVMTGGRERTLAEYERLLDAAGMRLVRMITTRSLTVILEGAAS